MRKRRQYLNKKFLLAVGETIRSRRLKLSLSQEELGARCDVHRTYITEIENGMRNISLLTLQSLAHGLGLEPWQLLQFAATADGEPSREFTASQTLPRKHLSGE
jgi:transcriptional regulator with XRE-family HTH domain